MPINPNAEIIARRLHGAGYGRAQIAGMLGNFKLESEFNPRVNEGGVVGAPLGRGGYGVAQWTGGRQKNLVNFAKQKKMDPGDPNLQADFLLHELSGPEKKAAEYVKGAVSPEEAARRFLTDFERAGIPKAEKRQEAARQLYGQLGFLDKPAGAGATAQSVQKGNEFGQSILQQVLRRLIPATIQPQSSLATPEQLLQYSNSALPLPEDYLNLFS
jgi:hypothetical protein